MTRGASAWKRISSPIACRSSGRPRKDEFLTYIDYIADRRLEGCGLLQLNARLKNPLPWLAGMMDIKKGKTSSKVASPSIKKPPPSP